MARFELGGVFNKTKDEAAALRKLHQEEVKLFGGQAEKDDPSVGQGVFILRVVSEKDDQATLDNWPSATSFSGYLGMGLWESGNPGKGNYQAHRQALEEGQIFNVELLLKPKASDKDKKALIDTLKIWGLLGGLGSRVRRGFGSIALECLNEEAISHKNTEAYIKASIDLIKAYAVNDHQPPYTAFSTQAQLGFAATKANARAAHEELGKLFKAYRGQPSDLRGSQKVFGMPYSGGTKEEEKARRASPLMFHVHPIGDKYKGLVLCLPGVFHHDTELNKETDFNLLKGFFKHLQEVSLWI